MDGESDGLILGEIDSLIDGEKLGDKEEDIDGLIDWETEGEIDGDIEPLIDGEKDAVLSSSRASPLSRRSILPSSSRIVTPVKVAIMIL